MNHGSSAKLLFVLGIVCLALTAQGTASAQSLSSCTYANGSNFNGTPIADGSFLWFNAVVKVSGIDRTIQTTISFTHSTISFASGSTTYQMDVPNSFITFSPTATEASTSFDGVAWITIVPSSVSQVFLDGLSFQVPAGGLVGGINPVTWSGTFISSAPVTAQWKWGAAVYTQFSTDEAAVGAKPVDGAKANPYPNSDHAGTPESFKDFVTGGARGGGGSNWTGSYSGTQAVVPCVITPE